MLTPADLLRLPFTPDLTEGGIALTVRSLPHQPQTEGPLFDLLRRRVTGAAVELAFRRYLSEQEVPYDVRGALPFTSPDRYDVVLGGRRCDLRSFLIKDRAQIVTMRKSPDQLLRAPALVPSDYHAAEGFSDHDLYLFAFLAGLTASTPKELKKAQEAGLPAYFLHALPEAWARPQAWIPLGPLALKSESDEAMTVELAGQAEGREFLSCTVGLPPRARVLVREPFFALTSIHIPKLFEGRLGIHSPRHRETHVIHWREWGNLWVYGMEIVLAGYAARSDFRRRARPVQAGTRVFQYQQMPEKHLSMPIAGLNPISELLTQARAWGAEKAQS